MLEADVCVQEEVLEVSLKLFEEGFRNLILDGGWQLVVEVEFFYNEVVIEYKRILDELLDRIVQLVRYLLLLVAVLEAQQPHV